MGRCFSIRSLRPAPFEIQNYIQAAGEARVIGGTLYVALIGPRIPAAFLIL